MATVEPIRYIGQQQLATDIANLKDALKGASPVDVFMPAASPASVEGWQVNRHYKTDEECLFAIAEAMREEYEAIVAAGFMLQVDDPRLAMHYMLHPGTSVEDCRAWARVRVEALNHALRNIPPARVRSPHMLRHQYGAAHPRHRIPARRRYRAHHPRGLFFLRGANPRHEHEWRIWETSNCRLARRSFRA